VKRSIAPSALLALGLGAAAAVFLYATSDLSKILSALQTAGWGIAAVLAVHVPQTLAATAAWRAVIPAEGAPLLGRMFVLRWVKDAVNALLPVAQVGGDVVRTRLLIRSGVKARTAIASSIVDVAISTASLFIYMLMGLGFLVLSPQKGVDATLAPRAAAVAVVVAIAVVAAPRLGLFRWIERATLRLTKRQEWAEEEQEEEETPGDLQDAIVDLYRRRKPVLICAAWHVGAWLLGAVETYVNISILGLEPTWAEAFLIDSLGQGFRAAGFLIPGALGVQEGGYVVLFGMFGMPMEQALAFSTIRRIRELALGVPGLAAWALAETSAKRAS